MIVPSVPLNDGNLVPQIGIGTWPLTDDELPVVIGAAVDAGYRHIDTASAYGNEVGVGRGIRASGVDRAEMFITTKVGNDFHGYDMARRAAADSLDRLGLDYVDMLLIHWPMPNADLYVETWRALIDLRESGSARSIGVSNFRPSHLQRLLDETGVVPAVNQIEVNPFVRHNALRSFNEQTGVVTESWSPLGPSRGIVNDPRLVPIAAKHGKTVGQVILRWHIDLGLVVIPKSATPSRIRDNIDVFDFALDDGDLRVIASFDQAFAASYTPRLAGDTA